MKNKMLAEGLPLALIAGDPASTEGISITPNAVRIYRVGAPENFTGHVVVEMLFTAEKNQRAVGGHVTFSPNARTAWHAHSTGQVLIVTDGLGWIQKEGAPKREIKAGDIVWIEPGVRHWHGATDKTSMRHISITFPDDPAVPGGWMEHVTDKQYLN
jgi:quercetin dioxygenase-like cupin family protein